MTEGRERRGTRTADRWLLSWAVLIAVSLLLPPELVPVTLPPGGMGLDKVGHAAAFFVLGLLAVPPARARSQRPLLVVLIASIVYGGLLEILQGALGWRSAEFADLVADGVGSAAGVLVSLWWRPT